MGANNDLQDEMPPENWNIQQLGQLLWSHVRRENIFFEDMKKMYKDFYIGNGVPSYVTQIKKAVTWIDDFERKWDRVVWLVVSTLIVQFILFGCGIFSLLGSMLYYIVQNPPVK